MNVCFETFGCRLNRAEALEEEARWTAAGHRAVRDHASAQVFVVRGCSVTARAQRDCERMIEHLRKKYPNRRVIVTGCLREKSAVAPIPGHRVLTEEPLPDRTARAYLKAQDGCSGKCTFCIVPSFRGKSVSLPFDAVVEKARRFAGVGYREIVLTGCNLTAYADGERRLAHLVEAIAKIGGCRVRLGSVEPCAAARDVVAAMADSENVCRFLHVPVQSGSDVILSAMRRPYRIRDVDRLLDEATARMPRLALGCDLMTGFPGETETDFLATRTLLRRHPFSNSHVFPYSERPGTVAESMGGSVPEPVRRSRAKALSTLADSNRIRFARQFLGRIVEVVVEHNDRTAGWTGEYLWFESPVRGFKKRELAAFRVIATEDGKLSGVPA